LMPMLMPRDDGAEGCVMAPSSLADMGLEEIARPGDAWEVAYGTSGWPDVVALPSTMS